MLPQPAGTTLGVEEEFHVVDAYSGELCNIPAHARDDAPGRDAARLHGEMLASQLEAVTEVCTDLDELRRAILVGRAAAAAAAAQHGATVMAISTHPFAMLNQTRVVAAPRYEVLQRRFGALVDELNLTGCHVHVGVPDEDTAIAIMNHARAYLPVLAALTGSSPFHEGRDTGFDSFRLAQLGLWPQGGMPPRLESAAHYRDVVAQLVDVGLVDEPSMLLWELRPSARFPTLEFRIADMCPAVDDAVLFAGVARSLVRVLARRVAAGIEAPAIDDVVLRAARWRAARHGLSGELWSVSQRSLVPAQAAIAELWRELEPDLRAHGEAETLHPLLEQLLARGTSATRQRHVFGSTGDLHAVVRDAIELTHAAATARPVAAKAAPASQPL